MKLCVIGRADIGRLEEIARELFSAVEDKNVTVPDLSLPAPAFDEKNLGKILRFIPVKDKDMI